MFVKVRNEEGVEGFGFLMAPTSSFERYRNKACEVIDHIKGRVKSVGRHVTRKSETNAISESDHFQNQQHQKDAVPPKFMGFIEKTGKEFRIVSSTDESIWKVSAVVQVKKVKMSVIRHKTSDCV